jgi:large subunit ribosomal protein L17
VRHRLGNRKLSRATDQRLAMLRSIVRSLFISGKIKLTLTRAKEARRLAERLITACKQNNLNSRRRVEEALGERKLVSQIFKTFPDRFEGRAGGYTRIVKIGSRQGDNAPMALLEIL